MSTADVLLAILAVECLALILLVATESRRWYKAWTTPKPTTAASDVVVSPSIWYPEPSDAKKKWIQGQKLILEGEYPHSDFSSIDEFLEYQWKLDHPETGAFSPQTPRDLHIRQREEKEDEEMESLGRIPSWKDR